ncbi:MAG: hypothetical protein GYA74_07890 [Acidobacteria bacterium]|nr:hypothetical protein [Acidobacteriota bacterium]
MTARLLLVNCYRENAAKKIDPYREWIQAGARDLGLKLEILAKFDLGPLPGGDYDGLIVSGSRQMIGRGQVEAGLLDFLRTNRRPLLGVCYGHQALARAFGGLAGKDAATHRGDEMIHLEAPDALFAGFPASFPDERKPRGDRRPRRSPRERVPRPGRRRLRPGRGRPASAGGVHEAVGRVHRGSRADGYHESPGPSLRRFLRFREYPDEDGGPEAVRRPDPDPAGRSFD